MGENEKLSYSIQTVYGFHDRSGRYEIVSFPGQWRPHEDEKVVWSRAVGPGDEDCDPYPADLMAEYERLCGRPEFVPFDEPEAISTSENIAEIMGFPDFRV